jgi:hypothetical protein
MKLNDLEIVLTKVALQEFRNNLESRLLDSYTIEERHYLVLQIKACDQMLNRIDSERKNNYE